MDINGFIKIMKETPDEKFNDSIKGALQLSDETANTVSFVFWLCYMAEVDLESVLTEAWEASSKLFDAEVNELAKQMLKEKVLGKRDLSLEDALKGVPPEVVEKVKVAVEQSFVPKRDFDVESLVYFSDKIKIYEAFFGKNERTKILWKINTIRNDISHNRVDKLSYNNEGLALRETKEKLLVDYLRSSLSSDFEDTEFYKNLTPEQKSEIEVLKKKALEV